MSAPEAVPSGADTSARPPEPVVAAPIGDRPVDAGDALGFVLALQARVRLDQLDPSETLDELFQGVSSRRNQVLIDLGREFGLSGAEGVQRQTIGELVKTLREQGAGYRFPGPYLREALAAGLARAGVARDAQLGLAPGLTQHVLARVAVDTRPGPSARGGELARLAPGPDLLDRARELTGADLGIALVRPAPVVQEAAPVQADPRLEKALLEALAEALGRPLDVGEPLPEADPDRERLAILDAELGEERATEIAPRFDARRHVRFTSAWASARWDLVTAYHDARAGRISTAELEAEIARLAPHGIGRQPPGSPSAPGRQDAAALSMRRDGSGRAGGAAESVRAWSALPLSGERPTVTIDEAGVPVVGRVPDDSRPFDLVRVAPDALAGELSSSLTVSPDLRGETALVTGASPGSIAAELVKRLLRGGARVTVATSTDTPERRRFYRDLYRTSAGPGAELHVVPVNLASFADIDALTRWLAHPGGGRRGRDDLRVDPLTPTILAPFAALSTTGNCGRGGRGLRDGAAGAVARRGAADRCVVAAHGPAAAVAQPRRVWRRWPVRRDEGRARGPAGACAGRAVGAGDAADRAEDRVGARHRADGRE